MFQLRKEHLDAIDRVTAKVFVQRLIDHLHVHQPGDVKLLSDDVVRRRVEEALAKAHQHGLSWESTLGAFVALSFHAGPRFDEHPEVAAVLKDAARSPDENMKQMEERVRPGIWAEIREQEKQQQAASERQ